MNIASAVAIYATITKELREPLVFPGNLRFYTGYDSHSHSKLIAGTITFIIYLFFHSLINKTLYSHSQNLRSGRLSTQTLVMNASTVLMAILQPGRICGPALPNTSASASLLINLHALLHSLVRRRFRRTLPSRLRQTVWVSLENYHRTNWRTELI